MLRKYLLLIFILFFLSSCNYLFLPPADSGVQIIYGEKGTNPLVKVKLYKDLEDSPSFSLSVFERWVYLRKKQLEPSDEYDKHMSQLFKLFKDTNWLANLQKEKLVDAIVLNPSSYVLDRPELYILLEIIQVDHADENTLNRLIRQKYEFEKTNKEIFSDSGIFKSEGIDYPGRDFHILTNHHSDTNLYALNYTRLIIPPQQTGDGKDFLISLGFYDGETSKDEDPQIFGKSIGSVMYQFNHMEFKNF